MTTEALAKKLVSINSVFFQEKEISDFLTSYLKNIGFSVDRVKTDKDRYNIIATYGKSKKYLGFYGHMDTVPPDSDVEKPFTMKIEGAIARGLGTEDMKGGIACILQTGVYAVKNNFPMKIIFGVDEENISQGAHDLVDSGLLNNLSFLIVAESGQIVNIKQPFNVCYGRSGRILYELFVFGRKAHAAESEKGINAIEKATTLVNFITKLRFPKHERLGETKLVVHAISGTTDSFSIPDFCRITFSLLTTSNIRSKTIERKIELFAKKQKITIGLHRNKRKTPYGDSYEVDRNNSFLKLIEKEIFFQQNVIPIYTRSVADENVFANRLKIPVISIGPIGGGGHTKDEWLDLESLARTEDVYKKIVSLYSSFMQRK